MGDDKYWLTSDVKGFKFDDEESNGDQLFGMPLKGASSLAQQLKDGLKLGTDIKTDVIPGQYGLSKGSPKYDLLQLINEKSLNAILEADTILEVPLAKSSSDPHKVQSRWITPDIQTTVKNILLGHRYSLELFQTLQSKKDLLNAALDLGDGDAILEVTLFLSRTLKKSLFQQLMFSCPVAVSHYIHYLSTKMQIQEATDLLELLGRHKDAAFKQFTLISSNPQRHLQKLKSLGLKYFLDSKDKIFVDNFARLIERQIEMKEEVGLSIVGTLGNLCEKHWGDSTMSPFILSKEHCVSDKQFQWIVLTSRAAQQDWESIHSMFITKGWLGSKKVKSVLPMDHIIMQLHKNKAPQKVLTTYLELVEDVETKLSLAKKLKCHEVIIDTFVNQRDRESLKNYMSSLSPQDDSFFYAESKLTSAIKWKN